MTSGVRVCSSFKVENNRAAAPDGSDLARSRSGYGGFLLREPDDAGASDLLF